MSESFEQRMKIFRENLTGMYDNGHMTKWADVDTSVDLDCLQAAHDYELEQTNKTEYHRGYEDGRCSMDAEHYAVALRLRALPLDGDTQENLAQIARAVWHSDFGWTEGACKALRDELVRLMGGVTYQSPLVNCGNPYGPGDAVLDAGIITPYDELGNERHRAACAIREIDLNDKYYMRSLCHALGIEYYRRTLRQNFTDVCERLVYLLGGDENGLADRIDGVHDDMECELPYPTSTYDELGNERHRAVYKLRGLQDDYSEFFLDAIHDAIGCNTEIGESATAHVRDRLIHLLGGDEPTESLGSYLSRKSVDAMSMRAESDESGEVTITAELRKWASDNTIKDMVLTTYPEQHGVHGILEQLIAIADRIDEQFDRICQQQEAVLQLTISELTAERDELQKRLDEMREQREHWVSEATKMYRLFFPHEEYGMPNEPSEMVVHKINELQDKLDAIREALDGKD